MALQERNNSIQEVDTINFIFDSYSQNQGTNDNPVYSLQYNISVQHPSHYFEVELSYLTIPFSINFINSTNNIMIVSLVIGGVSYPNNSITIHTGNYNILQLMASIQLSLQNLLTSLAPSCTSIFTVGFTQDEGVVQFSVTTGNSGGLSCTISPCFMGLMLGFQDGGGNFSSIIFSDTTPSVSGSHYNVSPISAIYVRSSQLLSKNYEMVAGNNQQTYSSIIGIQNITTSFDTYIVTTSLLPVRSKLTTKSIYLIDFSLTTDVAQIPVALRGCKWSGCLRIIEKGDPNLREEFNRRFEQDLLIKERMLNDYKNNVGKPEILDDNLTDDYKNPNNYLEKIFIEAQDEFQNNPEDVDNYYLEPLSVDDVNKKDDMIKELEDKFEMLNKNFKNI